MDFQLPIRVEHQRHSVAREHLFVPLLTEERDQGDPLVVECLQGGYRYYAYTTQGGEVVDGRAFPVYGSHSLVEWVPIGRSLEADPLRSYWAPWVGYLPELPRPWVMLYSRGIGVGIEGHIGHQLYRADSERPEGPFRDTCRIKLPLHVDFAIDPDVHRMQDGTMRLSFAADFVEGERIGTGLVEAKISSDLSTLVTPLSPIVRASADWQIFDAERTMPWKTVPGVDWNAGHTVCWHCIEGPASISDNLMVYSAGSFESRYGIGVLERDPATGVWRDLSSDPALRLLADGMLPNVFTPGHCSVIQGPEGAWYMVFHARFGNPAAPRQMALAPLVVQEFSSRVLPADDTMSRFASGAG